MYGIRITTGGHLSTPREQQLGDESCLGNKMPIIGCCPGVTCFYPPPRASPWEASERGSGGGRAVRGQHAGASVTAVCPALGGRVLREGEQPSEGQAILPFSDVGARDGNRIRRQTML